MNRREKAVVALAAASVIAYLFFGSAGPDRRQTDTRTETSPDADSGADRPPADGKNPLLSSVKLMSESMIGRLSPAEWAMLEIGDSGNPAMPGFGRPLRPPPEPADLPVYGGYMDTALGRRAFLNGRSYGTGDVVEETDLRVVEIQDHSVVLGWRETRIPVMRTGLSRSAAAENDMTGAAASSTGAPEK